MAESPYPGLVLKKDEERRLLAGHSWVFSNEVDTGKTDLKGFPPGEIVTVQASRGRFLGYAYVNPHSLICARLLSRNAGIPPDRNWLRARLQAASRLRERLFALPYYRLVHGEGDGLPGLIVDRFDRILVIQVTTAGMERMLDTLIELLRELFAPECLVLRNDTAVREQEGLEKYVRAVDGELPETITVLENDAVFDAPLAQGQKTGWFYDHRMNRAGMTRYVRDARVLDVFSYVGGWGIQAALAGAREVVCVDSSRLALEYLQRNAERNGVRERVRGSIGDAFDLLKQMQEAGERFDVVVLDPPAFIKRRKDSKAGVEAYQRLNELALRLMPEEGILISASCSFHLSAEDLQRLVLRAGRRSHHELSILERGFQAPDHPVHPAIAETAYLKSLVLRALAG
jgi:23S rRNA (cytosine1962-C5)-methyltransferase